MLTSGGKNMCKILIVWLEIVISICLIIILNFTVEDTPQ